eukprot:scaffold56227_cov39-Phaeocystis_antarctica.AAC.1
MVTCRPQQRAALEVAWDAMRGQPADDQSDEVHVAGSIKAVLRRITWDVLGQDGLEHALAVLQRPRGSWQSRQRIVPDGVLLFLAAGKLGLGLGLGLGRPVGLGLGTACALLMHTRFYRRPDGVAGGAGAGRRRFEPL